MSADLLIVLVLLAAAVAMFTLNRPRMDVVAVMMMVALPLTGVIDVRDALTGFSDPNIVLIAALFVIGEGLVRTGVAQRLGDWLVARAGADEARLIVFLMIVAAGIGSFMSSTGVVAIFIPIVLRVARNARVPAERLMMPLSVAALISGMMTLIATAPNLVVDGELTRRGYEGFGFFSFTPFGLPLLGLAILYMLAVRRFLGREPVAAAGSAAPSFADWIDEYGLAEREHRLRVKPDSPLAGRTLAELALRATSGANILAIERPGRLSTRFVQPEAGTRIEAGDIILLDLFSRSVDVDEVCARFALEKLGLSGAYFSDRASEIGMVEAIVPPTSPLVGRTVVDARFRTEYGLAVVGIKRGREALPGPVADERLEVGDTLLLVGRWKAVRRLMLRQQDLVLLNLPSEFGEAVPEAGLAPQALLAVAVMVVLMVTGIVPNVQAALIACLILGLFGCVDMNAAYRSIHWQTLVLIVGMLPFSVALQKTGGVDLAADFLLGIVGEAGPRTTLAAIFVVTALFGLFISNTATAVLMAPVALAVADGLGASPYPFAMTVALAASAAFMTPVSSPVNTLVMGPGNYTFLDFARIGVPFALVALATAVALVPWLLPF